MHDLHTTKVKKDAWLETQTLIELLQADAGQHDPIHLLKMLVLKKFNLAEMQIYSFEYGAKHICDLSNNQVLSIDTLRGRHFRALCFDKAKIGVMHFETHPRIYWFIIKPRQDVVHLFVGEGECNLDSEQFTKLQILLMAWEQWRAVEIYKKEASDLKEHLACIKSITDSLSKSYKRDEILLNILETAIKLSKARTGYIFIFNPEQQILQMRWVRGLPNPNAEDAVNRGLLNLEGVQPKQGIVGKVFSTGISQRELSLGENLPMDQYDNSHLISTMCIPLVLNSEVLGVIRLTGASFSKPFDDTDQNLVEILAANASSVLKRALLYEQTITDSLTSLHNRKHFEEYIRREIPRIRRYKRPATMFMMDIDHFKRINDTYGHHIGDEVLREVSKALKQGLREMDVLARIGGEEFALLLPETTAQNAKVVAERIRQQVKNLEFYTAQEKVFRVTISIGMAEIPTDLNLCYEEIFKVVDEALYTSKHNGRDQISEGFIQKT